MKVTMHLISAIEGPLLVELDTPQGRQRFGTRGDLRTLISSLLKSKWDVYAPSFDDSIHGLPVSFPAVAAQSLAEGHPNWDGKVRFHRIDFISMAEIGALCHELCPNHMDESIEKDETGGVLVQVNRRTGEMLDPDYVGPDAVVVGRINKPE